MDPPKKSPLEEPGIALSRFLEIASKLNVCARDLEFGVAGRESLPVLNLNRPYWWTAHAILSHHIKVNSI